MVKGRLNRGKGGVTAKRVGAVLLLLLTQTLTPFSAHGGERAISERTDRFYGPVGVRNLLPTILNLQGPRFTEARLRDSLNMSLSHSTVYMVTSKGPWSVALDMEMTEFTLGMRRVVAERVEVSVDLPIVVLSRGFMDSFINTYHRILGLPNYGREFGERNAFHYRLWNSSRGSGIDFTDEAYGVGDISLGGKVLIIDRPKSRVSLTAALEVPSGSYRDGIGNGRLDLGVAILSDHQIRDNIWSYLTLGVIIPGGIRSGGKMKLRGYIYGGGAFEAYPFKGPRLTNLGIIGELTVQTSPYPETSIEQVDTPAVIIGGGGRYRTARGALDLTITEDLNARGSPDFTLNITMRRDL